MFDSLMSILKTAQMKEFEGGETDKGIALLVAMRYLHSATTLEDFQRHIEKQITITSIKSARETFRAIIRLVEAAKLFQ